MCRALLYLGEPVLLDNFLYQPDSALVKQSTMPRMLHLLNLAGFGLRAWDPSSHDPERAYSYYSQSLPVFDRNLKNLAEKIRAGCLLAHVRGDRYHLTNGSGRAVYDVVLELPGRAPLRWERVDPGDPTLFRSAPSGEGVVVRWRWSPAAPQRAWTTALPAPRR
jgi:hypothetical protein